MYSVEWSEVAIEDLFVKVKTRRVAEALLRVSKTALSDHHAPDGGTGPGGLLWRRGLTKDERTELTRAEQCGESEDRGEQPWDFVLVYKKTSLLREEPRYKVLMVLRLAEIVEANSQAS